MTKKKKKPKFLETLQDLLEVAGASLMNREIIAVTPSGDKFKIEAVQPSGEGATIHLVPADTPAKDEDEDEDED